jgi:hypothetical protein
MPAPRAIDSREPLNEDRGFTKTANLSISRGLAKRVAGTGVTVNAVLPGPTLSEGVKAMLKENAEKAGLHRGGGYRFREGEPAELDHPAGRNARGSRQHGGLCLLCPGFSHHRRRAAGRRRRGRHHRLIRIRRTRTALRVNSPSARCPAWFIWPMNVPRNRHRTARRSRAWPPPRPALQSRGAPSCQPMPSAA